MKCRLRSGKSLPVKLSRRDGGLGGWIAEWPEANLSIHAATEVEAIESLTAIALDVYENLRGLKPEELGPIPAVQLPLLEQYIILEDTHDPPESLRGTGPRRPGGRGLLAGGGAGGGGGE